MTVTEAYLTIVIYDRKIFIVEATVFVGWMMTTKTATKMAPLKTLFSSRRRDHCAQTCKYFMTVNGGCNHCVPDLSLL
jgi:hypothetical protein